MAIKGKLSDTLCWKCKRATDGSCSWSKYLIPVEGWDAEKRERRSEVYRQTYYVKSCPLFKRG